ncbi:MAG: IS110 family transposase [Pirellulales bacterium]
MTTSPSPNAFAWTHFAGFDWACETHQVVVVDQTGRIAVELRFADDAQGWQQFRERLATLGEVAVAVETSRGAVVERLLEAGLAVYPVQPKAAERYRDRKAPSGAKNDWLDAWSLADALRTDGHAWRRLAPEDPLVQELRLLCRDERKLIAARTALLNQLQQALREYYPAALEAFDDWTLAAAWEFLRRFPTPEALRAAGRRKLEKFLHTHGLARPERYQQRLEVFARATAFCGPPAVTRAKSRLVVALVEQLQVLERQLQQYRQRIEELFAQHPDHELFGSLPGVGPKLGPRLLSELGDDRGRFDGPQALQCYAGTAPLSFQSGQMHRVRFRRACNKTLRASVHLWAHLSRHSSPWAERYYQHKRQAGMTHACALRCLGQRWLSILWAMWQDHTLYDEERHQANQRQHGSPVASPNPNPA